MFVYLLLAMDFVVLEATPTLVGRSARRGVLSHFAGICRKASPDA